MDLVTWNWALYDDAPCAREHFLAEVAALPGRPIILQLQDHDVPLHARGGARRRAQRRLDHDFWDAGARLARERIFLGEAYVPGDAEAALLAEINAAAAAARARGAGGAAACASEGGTPAATSWRPRRPPRAMRRRVRSWLPRARGPF